MYRTDKVEKMSSDTNSTEQSSSSTRMWSKDLVTGEKTSLFTTPRSLDTTSGFVTCEEYGCEYNTGLSNDGEIEQIGACADDEYMFSGITRTSVRSTKSPILRNLRPDDVWNMLVDSPMYVVQSFVDWLDTLLVNSQTDTVKTPRSPPPNVYLSDSVVSYEMMIDKEQSAKLHVLRNKYVPWIDHRAHDAGSDAKGNHDVDEEYMSLAGLSMYQATISMEDRIRHATSST
ncbi:hypothetical protein B0T18DRAFT_424081 [Schizothecium vesticola]|uniref:Uncharacterized protein n=1 Tax=Schizothecium vesticola TaxID=314040 RepID=A0AA40F978_9PEZI|nr:hypothetical protein B0T18DRAFT_424081 [Schizothecium vesticola]